jgi:hypothetical protein
MTRIEQMNKMLKDHLHTDSDTAYTDRELLMKLEAMVKAQIADNKKKVVAEAVEQAPPSTVFHVMMAKMTMGDLANLGVKLISVNNSELFWVTSIGQLYAFNDRNSALEAEYKWLNSTPTPNNIK